MSGEKVPRKIVLFFLVLAFSWAWAQPLKEAFPARITRWFDGDTASIRALGPTPPGVSQYETLRLLGVNAPEVGEPWADEATRLFRTLTMGKTVYVELNPWERRDTHSRLLGYLWVETDQGWIMVNEELLRAGLARVLVYYPEREPHYCQFLQAQVQAQIGGRGLWESAGTPLALGQIEADPVRYVTQAVSVILEVSRAGQDREGWSLWAAASRYGFHVVLKPEICRDFWNLAAFDPGALVGRRILVTGELLWDSLRGGPRIEVFFPEQVRLWEEEP